MLPLRTQVQAAGGPGQFTQYVLPSRQLSKLTVQMGLASSAALPPPFPRQPTPSDPLLLFPSAQPEQTSSELRMPASTDIFAYFAHMVASSVGRPAVRSPASKRAITSHRERSATDRPVLWRKPFRADQNVYQLPHWGGALGPGYLRHPRCRPRCHAARR